MHTVSFFGFKGGVGRSHLLLSVAYKLAQEGKFVVISDWDLQAPGLSVLEDLSRPQNEEGYPEGLDVRLGVLDFLGALLSKDEEIPDPKSMAQPTRLGQYARAESQSIRSWGDIWFIPAGRFDPQDASGEYHEKLRKALSLNLAAWQHVFQEKGMGKDPREVLAFFRERVGEVEHPQLKKPPDYLLIDSRTGMSEIGDLLLGTRFVDRMVILSGLTDQHFAGVEAVIRDLQNRKISPQDPSLVIPPGELRSRVTLVVSPVPQGEEILKRERLYKLHLRLDALARDVGHGERELMPEILQIPYHPFVAISDELMVRLFPDSELAQAVSKVVVDIQVKKEAVGPDPRVQQAAADVLDKEMPAPSNRPRIPYHPWSRMPTWNWPDPGVPVERFVPTLTEQQIPLLNGLARTISLTKEETAKILEAFREGKISEFQTSALQEIFREEHGKFGDLGRVHWPQLFDLLVNHFSEWLEIWNEGNFCEELEVLAAVVRGERDDFLGAWPGIGYFWFRLSGTLRNLKAWNLAEMALRKAIALDSSFALPWVALGGVLKELARTGEAEEAYRKAIDLDPSSAIAWDNLGDLIYAQERFQEAEEAYREATKLDSQIAAPWYGLGISLEEQNRSQEAEHAYRKATELDPKYAAPWNGLGGLLSSQARLLEAEEAYRKAIEINPRSLNAWNGLGNLLGFRCGRIEGAREAFRRAREIDSSEYSSYLNEAELLLVHGDLRKAESILQEAEPHLTTDYSKRSHAMLILALSLALQASDRIEAIHRSLEALNSACSKPSGWDYDDMAEFIERLEPAARDLLKAWITAVKRTGTVDVEAALQTYLASRPKE